MTQDGLCYLSASEATQLFRKRALSPVELMQAIIGRCHAVNPLINAFTHSFYDRAMDQARLAEKEYMGRGRQPRLLEGIPLVVKDGTLLKGEICTMGSKVYENFRPDTTHPGLERLLNAGAIVLARTTMPEFGESANCYTPLWGVTRNPWNLDYGPGGSSSGAGAAISAGMTILSDGSDIGGSIRIPASCCGVVGYKPPYGRNPNSLWSTFDPYMHYGPITRTVGDAALMQNILSGFHVEDIGTVRDKVVIPEILEEISGWKVAFSIDLGFYQVDEDIRRNTLHVMEILQNLGCQVEEVKLGWTEDVFQAWKTINGLRGSAARLVGDFERWRPYLADYTIDWLQAGSSVTQEQVIKAFEIHVAMYKQMGPLLDSFDALICPTTAIPSVEAERSPLDLDFTINGEQARLVVAEAWFMTYPFNMLSQLPVMSVPSGFSASGVPTGIQLVGPSFKDLNVFRLAAALEKVLGWPDWRPNELEGKR